MSLWAQVQVLLQEKGTDRHWQPASSGAACACVWWQRHEGRAQHMQTQ